MKVAVVGAGPSGLAVALGLVERGVDVTVYERAPHVGGRVRTETIGDYRVEHGPAGILSDAPATTALLRALSPKAPRVVHADPRMSKRYVVRDGHARALPTGPTSLIGGALYARDLLALWRERSIAALAPARETVAAFARRRFGAALATAFAQPIVVGVFGGDYEALELQSAFPALYALEEKYGSVVRGFVAESKARRERGEARPRLMTFAGGMGALCEAMAARLGNRVQTNVDVRLADLAADHIVIATSVEAASSLVPDLEIKAELQSIPSTPMASVSLAYRRDEVGHALDGFGLLCPRGEGKATMGIVFMTSVFAEPQAPTGEILLRVLMGGPNDPQLLDSNDTALLDRAHREVASLLSIVGTPTFSHLVRWPRAIPQYVVGHTEQRARIEAASAARNLTIAGTALRGIGVNDVIREAAVIVDKLAP